MRRIHLIFLVPALACLGFAGSEDVIPPAQTRAATLAFANKLTEAGQNPAAPSLAEVTLRSPFAMDGSAAVVPVSTEGSTTSSTMSPVAGTNRGKLEAIAPQVTPTGTVQIGGSPILLFGQKKLKVGDRLPILFEGQPYDLEISDIQPTSFTLRLNGEEITRPIKSAIKPKS